jgi:hypothetical protein
VAAGERYLPALPRAAFCRNRSCRGRVILTIRPFFDTVQGQWPAIKFVSTVHVNILYLVVLGVDNP